MGSMEEVKQKIKNPILQISCAGPDGTDDLPTIPINQIEPVTDFEINNIKFQIASIKLGRNKKQYELISKLAGKSEGILDIKRPIIIKRDRVTYTFQLANDFVAPDIIYFRRFLKHAVFLHIAVLIIFSVLTFFMPKEDDKIRIAIDQKRLQALIDKMKKLKEKEKEKEMIVATPVATPEQPKAEIKEEQKIAEKPPGPPPDPTPKKIEPPKKTSPKKEPVSLMAKSEKEPPKKKEPPPKQLVMKKGPPQIGAERKAPMMERASGKRINGGGMPTPNKVTAAAETKAKLASSLGFLASSASSKYTVTASSLTTKNKREYEKGEVGDNSKNYLNNIVTTASGPGSDGPIRTRGARTIATGDIISEGAVFGSSKGKSLNMVQGKVEVSRLQDYGPEGGAFGGGGGGGMQTSGKGSLSQALIEKTLAKHIHKLQYCYEKALLYDAKLSGTLTMQWTINIGGGVSGANVVKSELKNDKLFSCIKTRITEIKFPDPKGGSVSVKYPFQFTSSSL